MKLPTRLIAEASGTKPINPIRLERSERFCTLLHAANRKINLVSRGGNQADEITRQFLISLAPLRRIPDNLNLRWFDIGSGGGFPGIPLAIFRPRIQFHLTDSTAKKAFFLERTVEKLALTNVTVSNRRVEAPSHHDKDSGNRFDWLSVKAVTVWEETLLWGAAFLKPEGMLVTYKAGTPTPDEMRAIKAYGFELFHTIDLSSLFNSTSLRVLMLKYTERHN